MFACLFAPGNLSVLVECAQRFSPQIEAQPPNLVVFDVHGLERLYGKPEALAREIERQVGVPAQIALAENPDAAVHAARGFPGITVIPVGQEAARLASLPLNLLGGSPETAELLHLWGIRTFGEFAKLPPLGVAARLGEEGVHLQRLARGEGYRRLRPLDEPLEFEEELELDHPVDLLEPLSFLLSRLLNDVCGRLAFRAMATNELQLRFILERAADHRTTLRLPVPMLDPKAFLKMLQLDLSRHPPVAPVLKIHLRMEPVKPRRTQQGLFVPSSPEPEKLELTVARLRHLVGEGKVGSPRLRNTHRPDSFEMRDFAPPTATLALPAAATGDRQAPLLCLRRFRPPRYAQVLLINGEPVRLASPTASGRIVMAKGPWKTSGAWWQQADDSNDNAAWNREEWDVALESGELYLLSNDLGTGRWFLEGSFD